MSEQILVVPRTKLFNGKPVPHGYGRDDLDDLIKRIYASAYFIARDKAENDPSLKQIIPYLVVTYNDKIFLLQRHKAQTESRLHDKYSIAVGGHINPVEGEVVEGILEKGLERELNEELLVQCSYTYHLAGYLNDDSNPVGSVHFGLVYKIKVKEETAVKVAEQELMTGRFVRTQDIEPYYELLETWSQIVYKALHPKVSF